MTSLDLHSPRNFRARHDARQIEIDREFGFDDDDSFGQDGRSRWRNTVLFWLGVALLIAARVALFDPAAPRAPGGFPEIVGSQSLGQQSPGQQSVR